MSVRLLTRAQYEDARNMPMEFNLRRSVACRMLAGWVSSRGSPVETRHHSPSLLFVHLPFAFLHVLLMKLTLKHQLRPRPFTSMLGFLDLKTGVTLVVLFAVRTLNHPIIPALLTPFFRFSTRSLVFTASSPFSRAQVETLLNLPSTSTPPSPLSVSHGESAPSIKFATPSDCLSHPCSLFTHAGEPQAHALFCSHILRRSYPKYHLDRLFHCPMVAIYPPRRPAERKLSGAAGAYRWIHRRAPDHVRGGAHRSSRASVARRESPGADDHNSWLAH
jgi:hypothetical protein